jgi:uncharacterized protein (DUF58 family)
VSALLTAADAAAIEDLSLAARLVVEGARAGAHRSLRPGYSTEFRQHRPYQQGDDLKHLDWKALARTDRLYTRQFRETTDMAALVVLDTSASMAFPETGVSKFAYARVLAAALAHLLTTAGDAIGLLTRSDETWHFVPPRTGTLHRRLLFNRLEGLAPRGVWEGARVITRAAEMLTRRGMLIVLSDCYDDEDGVQRALRVARQHGHDVLLWQILSPQERSLPATRGRIFEDAESGLRREVDPTRVRAAYETQFAAFLARTAHRAQRDAIDHAVCWTDTDPAQTLRLRLLQRHGHVHAFDARAADD